MLEKIFLISSANSAGDAYKLFFSFFSMKWNWPYSLYIALSMLLNSENNLYIILYFPLLFLLLLLFFSLISRFFIKKFFFVEFFIEDFGSKNKSSFLFESQTSSQIFDVSYSGWLSLVLFSELSKFIWKIFWFSPFISRYDGICGIASNILYIMNFLCCIYIIFVYYI